jgi:hypothetical protein
MQREMIAGDAVYEPVRPRTQGAAGNEPAHRPRLRAYTEAELEAGYRAMAADEEYEREAREWCSALTGDIDDEA